MLDAAERSALLEQLARARTGEGLPEHGVEAYRRSPACGDEVTVRVLLDGDRIARLGWTGHGCTVSLAAASGLAVSADGVGIREFRALAERYLGTLTAEAEPDPELGDLEAFAGIGRYPLRAGCASLAWRAALDALGDADSG
jgi:nitrogen fixation NifU-like protein